MNFPDFSQSSFLRQHIRSILDFYEPNVEDPHGGFYQNFLDDGKVYDHQTRHLVSSARFVFNYARAFLEFNDPKYLKRVNSGIEFIRNAHFNPQFKSYGWLLNVEQGKVETKDDNNHCYGFAFVMLAYSWAIKVGHSKAEEYLEETWSTMERVFWDADNLLYKDEFDGTLSKDSGYRGQNANMHTCEALIAAYHATSKQKFLDRAMILADSIVNRQAALTNGFIWEHFHRDWTVDLEYNQDDPKNLFRPWGFQPGHQTEWAKLLLMLYQLTNKPWLLERAQQLFTRTLAISWDEKNKGIAYGFDLQNKICDGEKYFWVQAESFAAAAYLYAHTKKQEYLHWYQKIWQYSWEHMVDHKYGAWFRILSNDNQKLENTKSPIGKTDYHTMGACYDVLSLRLSDS
ncbi:AGE family epimerase/isomerase [Aliiglaciecola sp. 2_MG-2023]|uniref:AGE family epimerase/isomerase n=1 Tax=unclassified Aliiglaciecola TaxID=2593648 RepID=UPI0026E3967B|nr:MULTISPECIES: AGE family epimerase/isomerase [unclassified Aliiglaciecola]MDO6713007.1 AGE family epimerase/isomerase [Aliiglaciecola sp. 2_MG-2023]MDO6754046.1 AGE family epimerase/isomerase [Aliiglaciecola sp. 1_MG-2023]